MIKPCVILNGQVINIGPWDYQIKTIEISPEMFDDNGNKIDEARFQEVVSNPLPDGAVIEELDIAEDTNGGQYVIGTAPQESNLQKIDRLLHELAVARQKQDLMQLALDDLILGGVV
ncbi:hypothetical protein H8B09_02670 [Paenibacillus sp. PR3]|uniref:Phage protein n=1 Tax=Paenibacillus terricola TaxID=2763503 RepID=A0ABR8MQR7_9BACL|nr:hypothetical protein [Paenibacillus terricola]MBD3917641.1 hypothetical protein [Paenibacillus terricola]